ncbi:MAG TPA: 3'-5' exonuclease [Myxococcota bacterium]|nr:3'-5' exonuclease [Myxococcota bacterium]
MAEELTLSRPLVSFDVETTGLDVNTDRIIEIACVKLHRDGRRECLTRRVNPERPIGAQATAVHGISDADVADAPTFAALADTLLQFLRGCDLTGFNIEQFDLPLLTREFGRVGVSFPAEPVHVIDSWRIFLRNEPRDLSAAYRFYCGLELKNAHSAEADAVAAADILLAQVRRYDALPSAIPQLHDYCHPSRPDWLDPDGKIIWRDEEAVLSFGKHRHKSLKVLAGEEPDYLKWIASANFSEHVIKLVRDALDGQFPRREGATVEVRQQTVVLCEKTTATQVSVAS